MRVAVYGLWHLGYVTAACCAAGGHDVVGLDLDEPVVNDLKRDLPPLHEPGLNELIAAGTAAGRLSFTTDPHAALPFLDAATGLLNRQALLRNKILLMLGLLETTPEHVDFFTPRQCSRPRLVARLGWWVVRMAGKLLGGLILYPWAKRAR